MEIRLVRGCSQAGRVSLYGVIGFLLPFALVTAIALAFHHKTAAPLTPATQTSGTSSSTSQAATGSLPTPDEVSAANAAVLAYCRSDLRQDVSCSLVQNSDQTAPGFVEVGISTTGAFDPGGASGQGLGLAKGGGTSWSVVWVGQSCIPASVASQNGVPASLGICH